MRDDFPQPVKDLLAKRVAYHCSNPNCPRHTIGPSSDPNKSIMTGEAAHITAASPGGKRYNPTLTSDERSAIDNGIWLCSYCAGLVDKDENIYTVELLRKWKSEAEQNQYQLLANPSITTQYSSIIDTSMTLTLEQLSASVKSNTATEFNKMSENWREGNRVETIKWVEDLRNDIAKWSVLTPELKAKILRLEIKLKLEENDDFAELKELAKQAYEFNPSEDDLIIKVLLILYESGTEDAIKLLEGQTDASSMNLKAALLLEMGMVDECMEILNSENQE